VKSWLASLASTPPTVPEGDLVIAFDNNQVLQRRWKVKLRNEVKCNIVMVVVSFLIAKTGKLEQNATLKPSSWSKSNLDESLTKKIKYIDQDDIIKQSHYTHLYSFVDKELRIVGKEQVNFQTA